MDSWEARMTKVPERVRRQPATRPPHPPAGRGSRLGGQARAPGQSGAAGESQGSRATVAGLRGEM